MLSDSQQEILAFYGQQLVIQLRDAFAEKTASGDLVDSIHYEVDENGLRILAEDYILLASEGRGPGKFPPRKAIKDWIEDKGLSYDIPIDSLAFLIQRKIAAEGTSAWQNKENIIERVVTDNLPANIAKHVAADISETLAREISNNLNP